MAQSFPETAHLKTDRKAYGENYDRIFGKPKSGDSQNHQNTAQEPLPDTETEAESSLIAFLLQDE